MESIMLENSYLHESVQAKEIDSLLKEYQDITARLADLDESKKRVLERLFELSQEGKNETSKFVYSKGLVNGRQSISVKNLQEQAPDLYGKISGLGLVSVGKDYYVIRGIKLKGERS